MSQYDDIINLPHHTSKKYPRMSREARAAQFGAFRALTGHEEAVEEAARFTEEQSSISDNAKDILDVKMQTFRNMGADAVKVKISYFLPDERKSGGEYKTAEGYVKKIDDFKRMIIMDGGQIIPFDMIRDIECDGIEI